MNLQPFDLVIAVILLIGVARGRKRGMSEELLDVVKWLAIVFVAAFSYPALGKLLSSFTKMPLGPANVVCYLLAVAIVMFFFKSLKRAVGAKLVESDVFGRFEYYLGMLAGALRFACMTILFLAILNSRYSTPAERADNAKMQQENFGSISFPTIPTVQRVVFGEAASGKLVQDRLRFLLIEPVPPGPSRPDNLRKRREGAVNEAIGL